DGDPEVNPNAGEVCDDGIDNDCNGDVDLDDYACGGGGDDTAGDDDSTEPEEQPGCRCELPIPLGGMGNFALACLAGLAVVLAIRKR
ncbi:MAG: putative metal-binding motif-containing protein, partial [Myxococcota bacterium]|nr:putative metal-binding motif-containing protein [Myxococcota bacterium]